VGRRIFLYVREARDRDVLERYGRGTPNDWLEKPSLCACLLWPPSDGMADVVAFGIGWGLFVYAVQMVWIPFWAAGVITAWGHYWGYRNFPVEDASTNLFPVGFLIGGEEFHNNHHAHVRRRRNFRVPGMSSTIGWMYIQLLETLGLARVGRIAPVPGSARTRRSATRTPCEPSLLIATTCGAYTRSGEMRAAGDPPLTQLAACAAERESMQPPEQGCCVGCVFTPGIRRARQPLDSRSVFALGSPVPDRLFDATGLSGALEPVGVTRSATAEQTLNQLLRLARGALDQRNRCVARVFARRVTPLGLNAGLRNACALAPARSAEVFACVWQLTYGSRDLLFI